MSRQDKSFGTIGTMTGEHKIITSLIWLTAEILVAGTSHCQLQFVEGGDPKVNFDASTVSFIDLEKAKERWVKALLNIEFWIIFLNTTVMRPPLSSSTKPAPSVTMSIVWRTSKMASVTRFAIVCTYSRKRNLMCVTQNERWSRFRWSSSPPTCLPFGMCRWTVPWIQLSSQPNTVKFILLNYSRQTRCAWLIWSSRCWANRCTSMALLACRCAHGNRS